MSTYDCEKSKTTAENLAEFVRTDITNDTPLNDVPGVGNATIELFENLNINSVKDLVTKFKRFNRKNRTHEDVAQRFFQWLTDEVGGRSNKHTICEAIETYVDEQLMKMDEDDEETDVFDVAKSVLTSTAVVDFCRLDIDKNEDLTGVPGIGDASVALFQEQGINTIKDLIKKYKSFYRRGNGNDKFYKWQKKKVGGRFNKHSVTCAIENYYLEMKQEEP